MIHYTSRLNKKYLFYFFIVLFCINQLFFSSTIIDKIISYPLYPILFLQNKVSNSVKNFFINRENVDQLKKEILDLKNENENLFSDYIKLKSALNFLENASELIIFKRRYDIASLIQSKILFKQITKESHYGFIDKGSNDNVKKDMIAIYKNCILARVVEVYPKFSKIIFITDKLCKIAAFCSKTNSAGIYEGSNDLNKAQLNYINHLEKVCENDLVISSGEGLIFPHGFGIAKIVDFKNNGLQYNITVKPLLDIQKIEYCHLIAAY